MHFTRVSFGGYSILDISIELWGVWGCYWINMAFPATTCLSQWFYDDLTHIMGKNKDTLQKCVFFELVRLIYSIYI
jgi:hypothetical protein